MKKLAAISLGVLLSTTAFAEDIHHKIVPDGVAPESVTTDQLNEQAVKIVIPRINYDIRYIFIYDEGGNLNKLEHKIADALGTGHNSYNTNIDDVLVKVTPHVKENYDIKPLELDNSQYGEVADALIKSHATGTHQVFSAESFGSYNTGDSVVRVIKEKSDSEKVNDLVLANNGLSSSIDDVRSVTEPKTSHDKANMRMIPEGVSLSLNLNDTKTLVDSDPFTVNYTLTNSHIEDDFHTGNTDTITQIQSHSVGSAKLIPNQINAIITPRSKLLQGRGVILIKPVFEYEK